MYTVKAIALLGLKKFEDAEVFGLHATRQPAPEFTAFWILLAAQEILGKENEAKHSLQKLLKLKPGLSESLLEEKLPFNDPKLTKQLIDPIKRLGFGNR